MYDPADFEGLSTFGAIAAIKSRTDREADSSTGVQILVAHLEGIWDAMALLANRVDAELAVRQEAG